MLAERSPEGPFTARDLRVIGVMRGVLRGFVVYYFLSMAVMGLAIAGVRFMGPLAMVAVFSFWLAPVVVGPLIWKMNAPLPAVVLIGLSLGPVVSFVLMILVDRQATEALERGVEGEVVKSLNG